MSDLHLTRANEVTYSIDFFPFDWHGAEDVQIDAMGSLIAVESRALTREPNLSARPLVDVGKTLSTGVVTDLVALDDSGWLAQVALFAQTDTAKDRTRRHVRCPGCDDAGVYGFLWSGDALDQLR